MLKLKQNNPYAAVTVTSALAFKGVGPRAGCLSTDISTIFRRMSVKRLHSTVFGVLGMPLDGMTHAESDKFLKS